MQKVTGPWVLEPSVWPHFFNRDHYAPPRSAAVPLPPQRGTSGAGVGEAAAAGPGVGWGLGGWFCHGKTHVVLPFHDGKKEFMFLCMKWNEMWQFGFWNIIQWNRMLSFCWSWKMNADDFHSLSSLSHLKNNEFPASHWNSSGNL